MISEKHKSIFVHIPKTAGTSIEKKLGLFEDFQRGVQDHRTIIELRNSMEIMDFKKYFKFSFVRNPWDRVFSWYRNVMRDPIHRKGQNIPDDCSFAQFLECFSTNLVLKPQLYWLEDEKGDIPLDFIGRFENLSEDFKKVSKAIGIKEADLPHYLSSQKPDYRDFYNEKTKKIVESTYIKEIKMFNYCFGEDY